MSTVHTTDPCNKAIVGTLVIYQLVKVVYVMTAPCAVAMAITNGTISTLKIVDTIFFAISVLALPKRYRVAAGAVGREVLTPGVDPCYSTWP